MHMAHTVASTSTRYRLDIDATSTQHRRDATHVVAVAPAWLAVFDLFLFFVSFHVSVGVNETQGRGKVGRVAIDGVTCV